MNDTYGLLLSTKEDWRRYANCKCYKSEVLFDQIITGTFFFFFFILLNWPFWLCFLVARQIRKFPRTCGECLSCLTRGSSRWPSWGICSSFRGRKPTTRLRCLSGAWSSFESTWSQGRHQGSTERTSVGNYLAHTCDPLCQWVQNRSLK